MNRGLYMNERTYQRSADFDRIAADLGRLAAELMSLPEHYLPRCPRQRNSRPLSPKPGRTPKKDRVVCTMRSS